MSRAHKEVLKAAAIIISIILGFALLWPWMLAGLFNYTMWVKHVTT